MTKKRRSFTPAEIRALRQRLNLTVEQAAEKVGVTARTWHSWEQPSQKRSPSPGCLVLLRQLAEGSR